MLLEEISDAVGDSGSVHRRFLASRSETVSVLRRPYDPNAYGEPKTGAVVLGESLLNIAGESCRRPSTITAKGGSLSSRKFRMAAAVDGLELSLRDDARAKPRDLLRRERLGEERGLVRVSSEQMQDVMHPLPQIAPVPGGAVARAGRAGIVFLDELRQRRRITRLPMDAILETSASVGTDLSSIWLKEPPPFPTRFPRKDSTGFE
jgi:hypothetical protein